MRLRSAWAWRLALPVPAQAQGITLQRSEPFARALQAALPQPDPARVADPLRVDTPGQPPRQLGQAALLQQSDQVCTPAVVHQVLQQDPAPLFHNDRGLVFGSGAVRADEVCPRGRQPGFTLHIMAVDRPVP